MIKKAEIRDRLTALRLALQHEHFMPPDLRYQPSEYDMHVKPLVVQLNTWLVENGHDDADERRKTRLRMLSAIVQRKVETSYDLTKEEAKIIRKEFTRDIEERKSQLLNFLSKLPKDGNI